MAGGVPGPVNQTKVSVVNTIIKVSQKYGLPPGIALATAINESGLNPQAVGDNGTSFGLFQLHEGGELGSLSQQQAFDPETNAETAIPVIAAVYHQHPNWTPGQIAAAAQRPRDTNGYAQAVNGIYNRYNFGGNAVQVQASLTDLETQPTSAVGGIVDGVKAVAGGVGDAASALASPAALAGKLLSMLSNGHLWVRVGEFLLGGFLLIVGMILLFKNDIEAVTQLGAKAAAI